MSRRGGPKRRNDIGARIRSPHAQRPPQGLVPEEEGPRIGWMRAIEEPRDDTQDRRY